MKSNIKVDIQKTLLLLFKLLKGNYVINRIVVIIKFRIVDMKFINIMVSSTLYYVNLIRSYNSIQVVEISVSEYSGITLNIIRVNIEFISHCGTYHTCPSKQVT